MKGFSKEEIIDYEIWNIWFADINFNHAELNQARSIHQDIWFFYCFDLNVIFSPQITSQYQGYNCSELLTVTTVMDEWIDIYPFSERLYNQALRDYVEHYAIRELLMVRDGLDVDNDEERDQATEAIQPIRIELWKQRWIWRRELNQYPEIHEGLEYSAVESFIGLSVEDMLRLSDSVLASIEFTVDEILTAAEGEDEPQFYYDAAKNIIWSPQTATRAVSEPIRDTYIASLSHLGDLQGPLGEAEWYKCPISLEEELRERAMFRCIEEALRESDLYSLDIYEEDFENQEEYETALESAMDRLSAERDERNEDADAVVNHIHKMRPIWRREAIRNS